MWLIRHFLRLLQRALDERDEENRKLRAELERLMRELSELKSRLEIKDREWGVKVQTLEDVKNDLAKRLAALQDENLKLKERIEGLLRQLEVRKRTSVLRRDKTVTVEIRSRPKVRRQERFAVRVERRSNRSSSSVVKSKPIFIAPRRIPTLARTRAQKIYLAREVPTPPRRAPASPRVVPKDVGPPKPHLSPGKQLSVFPDFT